MKLNQRGSSQVFLCLALLMALSGITIVTVQKLEFLRINRIRLKALICMRKSHFYQSKFIYKVNSLNRPIQVAYYATKLPNPQISATAKMALEALKIKQQLDLLRFYKDIYQIKECSKITISNIILNPPYKLKAKTIFKRSLDDTVILSSGKSLSYIYSSSEKLSLRSIPILFKSTIKVDNKFDKDIKIMSKDFGI